MNAAIFNLKITDYLNKMQILSALMAVSNVRSAKCKYGSDHFFISMRGISESSYIVLAAKAIENVYTWGWKPTPPLSSNINKWIEKGAYFKNLPDQLQSYIFHWVDKMRKDCSTVEEHPIKRQQRLLEYSSFISSKSLKEDEINLLTRLIIQKNSSLDFF